jgi:hypothetical protein
LIRNGYSPFDPNIPKELLEEEIAWFDSKESDVFYSKYRKLKADIKK